MKEKDIKYSYLEMAMRNLKINQLIIIVVLFVSCTTNHSKIRNIYLAEKMFFKAEKAQRNILINPDIVSPEEYQKVEKEYRAVIDRYSTKSKDLREIKGIIQRSWLALGDLKLLQKKYNEAITIYKEIIAKSLFDKDLCAIAQFSIARTFEGSERIDEAIGAFQQLVQDYPPVLSDTLLPNLNILNTPIYIARLYIQGGQTYSANEQYEKARRYYEEVIRRWPNSQIAMAAQTQTSMSYGDQNRWDESVSVLQEIVRSYPDNPELVNILYTLGTIYQRQLKEPYRAYDIYQQIIRKYPQTKELGTVYLALGGIDFSQEKYQDAREDFRYVLDHYRNDNNSCIQAQLAIAKSYELENNWNKALNEYQWLMENYPQTLQSMEIPLYIADYYNNKQDNNLAKSSYENAIQKYRDITNTYPNTRLATIAYDYMATCFLRLEKWGEAGEILQSMLSSELPAVVQINTYLKLGSIYDTKLNEAEKAVKVYSDLLQKYPQIPMAQSIQERTKQLQQHAVRYQQSNEVPRASEIGRTAILSSSSVQIDWTQNRESDFNSYRLFRSESPNVSSSDLMIAEFNDQQQNSYTDKNLEKGNTYYYRVYVVDRGGLNSGSREVGVTLQTDRITSSVSLQASSNNWSTGSLVWSRYQEKSFDSYKIYRSRVPGVDLSSQLVKSIFDPLVTRFEDNDLKEKATYYYRVYVFNISGDKQPSNEVMVQTPGNTPPSGIVLNNPVIVDNSTIKLSWSPNRDSDFYSYRIYRSERSPVSINSAPIWMSSNQSMDSCKDAGIISGKGYYYKLVVYDKGNLFNESNEVYIKL